MIRAAIQPEEQTTPATAPLLVTDEEAGRLVGLCRRAWRGLDAKKATPAGILIGRNRRWRMSDLTLWTELGCPTRDEFEVRKKIQG